MNSNSVRKLRAALAFAFGAALPYLAVGQTSTASGNDQQAVQMQKYVVTGSNIPTTLTAAEAGTYPLVSLNALDIAKTGYENAAALLQKLTISNAGSVAISNNATGFTPAASGVSLRGLGPEATLVLINGHRVASYPVGQSGDIAFVDLNTIPLGMIDRIEVLKDGASAVYGADAVAGVVNIILRKNYNGSEAKLSYQNTTNKDSSQFTGTFLTGVSNDRGSITIGFNYQSRAAIYNKDRSYSAVPAFLSSNSSPINAQISVLAYDEALGMAPGTKPDGVSGNAFFATPGPITSDGLPTASDNHGNVPPSQWTYSSGRRSAYNYNQDSSSFPSWTRYGMILNGDHKVFDTDNIKVYFDGNYQLSTTENQLAPSATGNFLTPGQTTLVIPARTANPILTVVDPNGVAMQMAAGTPLPDGYSTGAGTMVDANGLVQRVAAAGAYNPFNPFNQDITDGTRFRTKEFGNRIFRDTNEAFMATLGLKGDNIAGKYNFDAGFRYSDITYTTNDTLVSASRFDQVLNANSTLLLNNGITTPYNPFGYYANPIPANAAVTALASVHLHDVDISSIGNAYLTVNTTNLFDLPAGGVGAAAGLDYRVESLKQSPDTINREGDSIGSSPAIVTDHTRKVFAGFMEFEVPLASPSQKIPGLYNLSLNLAGRYENFLTSGDTVVVPKIGIRYQPVDDSLTFRASASKGFLEPSMYQLYAGAISGLLTLTDPRTGTTITETPIINSGNSQLHAEHTKAYNLGVVWSPKFHPLNGFTTNVDLWRVERNGTPSYDFQDTLDRWGASGNAGLQAGEAVFVDAAGNIAQVRTQYHNAGDTIADGIDFGASYLLKTENSGRFDFSAGLSYLHSFRQALLPGQPMVQYVDTTQDGEGQDGFPKRKARVEMDWTLQNYSTVIAGNYIDGWQDYDLNGDPRRVASTWTFDVRFNYTFHGELGAYLKDTTVSVGAINVLNRTPPLSQFFGANPDNYPGFVYTAEDRMLYVSLDKKF